MRVRKTICLLTAAALAACMLTGCPWEEDPAASSSGPSSSSSGASGPSGGEDADAPDAPSSSSSSSSQPETPATYTITVETTGCTCAGETTVEAGNTVTLTDHIYLEEDWKQVGNWNVGYTGTFDGNGKPSPGWIRRCSARLATTISDPPDNNAPAYPYGTGGRGFWFGWFRYFAYFLAYRCLR